MNSDDHFATHDISLATILSLSYPIVSIDKANPRRAQFLFKRNEALGQFVKSYWRGELKVEPKAYFNQLRIIKSRLHESD